MAIRETDWPTCGSPVFMRRVILARPYPSSRWILFNLACVSRISDLLDPSFEPFVQAVSESASLPHLSRFFMTEQEQVRQARRLLYGKRQLQHLEARIAAHRALEMVAYQTLETSEMVAIAFGRRALVRWSARREELRAQCDLIRDIFGNPFRPVAFADSWRSESAVALARAAYDTRNFTLLPILADALEEAGCDSPDVLTHCRGPGPHVRGCWVVDGVLGKG